MTDHYRLYLDILHLYRSETVAKFSATAKRTLYGLTTAEKLVRAVKSILKSIKNTFYFFDKKNIYQKQLLGAHWIYLIGNNNLNSLSFIKKELPDTIYVTPFKFSKKDIDIIPLFLPYHFLFLLKNIPTFFSLLLQKEYPIQRCWDAVVRTLGQYESAYYLLKKYRPAAISFSNDHTIEARAMLLAANALDIPTFYVQHACVRPDFPPLKFSVSFLEGQDALDKYRQSGPVDGAVALTGVPRITAYLNQKNKSTTIKKIGLCSNLLDEASVIEKIMYELSQAFPDLRLTYRPHPSDQRTIILPAGVDVSNSREENPFAFLVKQDAVIAGNTSIHYEAVLLNVLSIYYKFDPDGATEDMYSFVKNKLVPAANNPDELIKLLNNQRYQRTVNIEKASYYDATIGTLDEGRSHQLVLEKITAFLHQHQAKI